MSARTKQLLAQYNARITALLENIPQEVKPSKESLVLMAARDFYQNILDLDNIGFSYIGWLSVLESFLKYPAVLELDPDHKLEKLADRVLNCPELLSYYKHDVDNGVELDRLQLLIMIKHVNQVLGIA